MICLEDSKTIYPYVISNEMLEIRRGIVVIKLVQLIEVYIFNTSPKISLILSEFISPSG